MIFIAKLPSQVYTTVLVNLVSQVKDKAGASASKATVQRNRLLQAVVGLQNFTKIVAD